MTTEDWISRYYCHKAKEYTAWIIKDADSFTVTTHQGKTVTGLTYLQARTLWRQIINSENT